MLYRLKTSTGCLLILCLGVECGIFGCSKALTWSKQGHAKSAAPSVGRTLNPLRRQLGLRVVGDDWILYRSDKEQEDWKIHENGPLAKTIFLNPDGTAKQEEDYYYSGAQFTDQEGHGWERITVNYNYENKTIYISYSGTNNLVAGPLAKYKPTLKGRSSDINGPLAVLKQVASGWPDFPK